MKDFKQGAQCGEGVVSHGETMGFKKGGHVKGKNTSGEFVMKTEKMKSMDTGVQPARKGRNDAEKEAGGTKRMLPGYKDGGKVDGYRKVMKGGKTHYMKGGVAHVMKGGKMHKAS